jgi:hypothetical protein
MHMHPTVTHAAADHRRQDYLTEAAASWNSRPTSEQLSVRRKTQFVWRITSAVDCFLSWLMREFAPTPQAIDLEQHPGRPLSTYGPH